MSNGAQIVTPHDVNISNHISKNLEMDDASWDISAVLSHPLRRDPLFEIDKSYYECLSTYVKYKYGITRRGNGRGGEGEDVNDASQAKVGDNSQNCAKCSCGLRGDVCHASWVKELTICCTVRF